MSVTQPSPTSRLVPTNSEIVIPSPVSTSTVVIESATSTPRNPFSNQRVAYALGSKQDSERSIYIKHLDESRGGERITNAQINLEITIQPSLLMVIRLLLVDVSLKRAMVVSYT